MTVLFRKTAALTVILLISLAALTVSGGCKKKDSGSDMTDQAQEMKESAEKTAEEAGEKAKDAAEDMGY